MSYVKTNWTDNSGAKINATNLNKIEDELEYLDDNKAVINDEYSTSINEAYSCNYVNNIIGSGTGYIKYQDGTMICYGNESGNGTLSGYWDFKQIPISITYAQTFISIPTVVVSGGGYGYLSIQKYNLTATGFDTSTIKMNESSDTDYNISYVAIGKWK